MLQPPSNDGGGGERVLWNLVKTAQQELGNRFSIRIYHGDRHLDGDAIVKRVEDRFGIRLLSTIDFVVLSRRDWVESSKYGVATMVGQALGSVVLGLDALLVSPTLPDVVFDSMGYAFAYPVFRWLGCARVLCYTHYPMISSDMLERVLERRPAFNNDTSITSSATLSAVKSMYYRVFAWTYGYVGRNAEMVMVNSKWTQAHIVRIWKCPERVYIVYPSVDTEAVSQFDLKKGREDLVISVAQFRPEKDQPLQVRAFALFRQRWLREKKGLPVPTLVLIGSVRNASDEAVVAAVKETATKVGLQEGKDFRLEINVSFATLLSYLKRAKVGLHSMWNEHFGIGVVELMAAGVLTIAHNSGGPKSDIVCPDAQGRPTGFLAETDNEYADYMMQAFEEFDKSDMSARARVAMAEFSNEKFGQSVAKLYAKFFSEQKGFDKKKNK